MAEQAQVHVQHDQARPNLQNIWLTEQMLDQWDEESFSASEANMAKLVDLPPTI